MPIHALNEAEIAAEMEKTSFWRREGREIVRVFQFNGFMEAVRFVNAMAEAAEGDIVRVTLVAADIANAGSLILTSAGMDNSAEVIRGEAVILVEALRDA